MGNVNGLLIHDARPAAALLPLKRNARPTAMMVWNGTVGVIATKKPIAIPIAM